MYDAECDVGALAFSAGDDPDGLLLDFAQALCRSGFRPVGLVQKGRAHDLEGELGAVMFPAQQLTSAHHDRGHGAAECRLDTKWLADIAAGIEGAIAEGADLVIVNRFGKLEADGRGLIDLIQIALDADIPVLIAVPEHRFTSWIKHSGGMNVRIPCRRDALDRWWHSVRGRAAARAAGTFCEVAK